MQNIQKSILNMVMQKWLNSDYLIIDTETTGLDNNAEVIEIAIINMHGDVLLNSLVKPTCSIPAADSKGFRRPTSQRRCSMKLKMNTSDDSVIVESNLVTQFYPDHESGGELTIIETISATGETFSVKVKHSFLQVTSALATAWSIDEKKAEGAAS